MRTVVAGLACLPLLACIDRSLSELPPTPDTVEKKTVSISLNNELDLLFVVDNSGSMLAEHQSLESRFPELIRALDELGPRRPDLHIGVVTSDMGTGRVDTGNARCNHSDGGRMQGGHCPALGGATFLSDVVGPDGSRVTNYTGTLDAAFACMADVGTDGCGFEQHLASMQAALSPGVNPGFLRKSANLGIVILADEDDCSTEDDRLFTPDPEAGPDPALGPFSDFRCFEHGVTCDPVTDPRAPGLRTGCVPREDSPYLFEIEQYIAFLGGLKDRADQVFVSAIVGDPDHVEVVGTRAAPALDPGCTGGLGEAAPAIRLAGLIDAFPGQSHRETICTGDLGAALRNIGENLPPPPACFARPPVDQDLITPGMQAECSVVEVADPDGPNRRENPLAACRAGGPRPCWQIVADPQCTQTAEHWRIDVQRDTPGPAGGNLEVQCVVSIPVPPPV